MHAINMPDRSIDDDGGHAYENGLPGDRGGFNGVAGQQVETEPVGQHRRQRHAFDQVGGKPEEDVRDHTHDHELHLTCTHEFFLKNSKNNK